MVIEGCKHEVEISVPVDEIARETDRVVANIQQKVKLPGFRPGKVPINLIRTKFAKEVREDVIENLLPKYFQKKMEEEDLQVVGRPSVKDVEFKEGEPLRFKAEFEVAPTIDLKEYRGVTVHYSEPQVTDEDIAKRLEEIRDQKAQFVNVDPRPAADGDYAVVSLDSLSGGVGSPHNGFVFMGAVLGAGPLIAMIWAIVSSFKIEAPTDAFFAYLALQICISDLFEQLPATIPYIFFLTLLIGRAFLKTRVGSALLPASVQHHPNEYDRRSPDGTGRTY